MVFEEPCGAEHRRYLCARGEQTEGYRSKQKSPEGITPGIIPVAPLKLPFPIQNSKGTGWEVVGDIAVNLHSKGMVAVWVAGLSKVRAGGQPCHWCRVDWGTKKFYGHKPYIFRRTEIWKTNKETGLAMCLIKSAQLRHKISVTESLPWGQARGGSSDCGGV